MIKYLTPNNRSKTYYAKFTREQGNNTWTVERVNRLDKSNQYSCSLSRDNKREFTSALKKAAADGTMAVT
jgi:hypothetical protein